MGFYAKRKYAYFSSEQSQIQQASSRVYNSHCIIPSSHCTILTDDMYMSSSAEEELAIADKCEQEKTNTDPMIQGVSILDFLTENEIQAHLSSLRTSICQDIEGRGRINRCDENTCNLCGEKELKFAPEPIYCSTCNGLIKEDAVYYSSLDDMALKSCFCTRCFKAFCGRIALHGKYIYKSKLLKEKNNHKNNEPWVECNNCGGWQHQICGLYNDKNDLDGEVEYICPKCYLVRIKTGTRVPIQKTPTFAAKNLPTTKLGDYIEKRLLRRLKLERKERAKASQMSFDLVPGANDLVVRVVVSVNKLLKVNEQFSQIFQDQKYPYEFPYRSKVGFVEFFHIPSFPVEELGIDMQELSLFGIVKNSIGVVLPVILLFQKIDGVDVCLFTMYVQEYGSECGRPNQRSVYISHIDSVKHFRPEIRSAHGEALRTFVYHEILIGYLDYCKKRGFETAYIWSCPPAKGDDYVFYCHPKTQKTPKPENLRQWYKSMLKKAAKENIVVGFTNLYDYYFVPDKESNIKVSAARLPYFDGDYWPAAAIGMIQKIEKEIQVNFKKNDKEVIPRRTLKTFIHKYLSEDATKDILLMQQMGEIILPTKENFIMVHLQVTCTHCHEKILSGTKWHCDECKNIILCSKCYQSIGKRHTLWYRENHLFSPTVITDDVAADTEDAEAILETSLFENRNSFLSLCQGKQLGGPGNIKFPYQFDSLRRAKHSTMMILYLIDGINKKTSQDCGQRFQNLEPPRN